MVEGLLEKIKACFDEDLILTYPEFSEYELAPRDDQDYKRVQFFLEKLDEAKTAEISNRVNPYKSQHYLEFKIELHFYKLRLVLEKSLKPRTYEASINPDEYVYP